MFVEVAEVAAPPALYLPPDSHSAGDLQVLRTDSLKEIGERGRERGRERTFSLPVN